MSSPDPFAELDAAYSLGALDADDMAAYEAHLRTCADCRARVEQLRPTVRLLAAARAAGFDDPIPGPVPDTLLPGLLRQAGRERARRRWLTTGIAGVAAACLIALVVVLWPASSAPKPAPRALTPVGSVPVHATARLVAKSWGTQIDIRCAHEAAGHYFSGSYGLRVIDRNSNRYNLGTWSTSPDSDVSFTGGVAVRRERIARVQIVLPNGTPILQLAL